MPTTEFHLVVALTVGMAGVSAFLLCLAALDLVRAAAVRLWLLLSPGAARQARFRAALAACQCPPLTRESQFWRCR